MWSFRVKVKKKGDENDEKNNNSYVSNDDVGQLCFQQFI